MLITTSDLTLPAKKEDQQFKVDYWHCALLEEKVKLWGKWQPSKKSRSIEASVKELKKAQKEVAATSSVTCKCGAPMVRRKGKHGEFLGCSKFSSCRYTKVL